MKRFRISVHVAESAVEVLEFAEGAYEVGSGENANVRLQIEGVAQRHAVFELRAESMRVDDFGGGISVNGYALSGHVEVEVPASIELPGATLVVEAIAVASDAAAEVEVDPFDAPTMVLASSPNVETGLTFLGSVAGQFLGGGAGGRSGAREAVTRVRYGLEKELAQGGMGIVYVGSDPELDRELAVKVSKVGSGEDPRFALEAKVLGQLAHPNIVPIHAMGIDEDGFPFYSMKLVKGRSLQNILKGLRKGEEEMVRAFSVERLLEVFRKVCDAMAFAHSKGVLHRDLKPDNVMVGEFGEVLVMDWGLAKFLGKAEESGGRGGTLGGGSGEGMGSVDFGMTMEGEVMGTPQYMSPEQAEGNSGNLDERSDVYALGAILYAILTYRAPIEGQSLEEVLEKVRSGVITPMQTGRMKQQAVGSRKGPDAMERKIPEALRAVTMKAMATDREKRYRSVSELSADIEAYQRGFATRAENAGMWKRMQLWVGRNKVFAASAAILFIAGVSFMVRLTASERKALASAREALVEREYARDAAAKAQIALAEAAERDLNGEDMETALLQVPEDLRNQNWEYLNSRLHAESLILDADPAYPWDHLLPNPARPGKCIAIMSAQRVGEIDLETGVFTEWFFRKEKPVHQAAVFLDGKKIVFFVSEGYNSKKRIEILSLPDGAPLAQWDLPNNISVRRLQLSPDQKLLFVLTAKGTEEAVSMFSVEEGKELWRKDSEDPSVGLSLGFFDNSGKFRLLSERAGVLELDPKSGEVLKYLSHPHSFPGYMPTLGRRLYLQMDDHLFLWSGAGGHLMKKFSVAKGELAFEARTEGLLKDVGYLSSHGYVAELRQRSEKSHVLHWYPLMAPDQRRSIPWTDADTRQPWRLCIDTKSGHIVAYNRYRLHVWREMPLRKKYHLSISGINGLSQILSDSRHLLLLVHRSEGFKSCEWTGPHQVKTKWSIEDPKLGLDLVCTPDREKFALRLSDKKLKMFDRKGGDLVEHHEVHCHLSGPLALSPDGMKIWDVVGIFDTSTGNALAKAVGKMGAPSDGGTSPRWLGNSAVAEIGVLRNPVETDSSTEMGRVISIWNAENGQRTLQINAPKAYVLSASPDGKWLVEGGLDMRIRVREATTLKVVLEFRAHDASVRFLDWHPKKPLLLSGGEDGVIKIWDLWNAHLLESIVQDGGVSIGVSARFSADGKSISAVGGVFSVYEPECLKGE